MSRRKGGSRPISKDTAFNDCVVLDKDFFDPDAVFLDDIVDDDVLPSLSLAVDGLTTPVDRIRGGLELDPANGAANEAIPPSNVLPEAQLGPDHLEVYGWETSLWRKIRGYLGF